MIYYRTYFEGLAYVGIHVGREGLLYVLVKYVCYQRIGVIGCKTQREHVGFNC